VFGDLTVRENLQLGAHPARARAGESQMPDRVFGLFPKLAQRLNQAVRTMSGGEQQMVAVGRALMSHPEILLLDEPSLGLSPLMCKELFGALSRIRTLGVGVLLVEQNARQSLAIARPGVPDRNRPLDRRGLSPGVVAFPGGAPGVLGWFGPRLNPFFQENHMTDISMLIGGAQRAAANGATFERRNPLDHSVATRAPSATVEDARAAVRCRRQSLPRLVGHGPRRAPCRCS